MLKPITRPGKRVAMLDRRVVVLQEGGYFVPDLGENVRSWLLGPGTGLALVRRLPDAC
jgi:hypothetical protein